MAGTLQPPVAVAPTEAEVLEVETEDEAVAMALAACPEGGWVELHSAECELPGRCRCIPIRLVKGAQA